jgi:hypothetical protein
MKLKKKNKTKEDKFYTIYPKQYTLLIDSLLQFVSIELNLTLFLDDIFFELFLLLK